MIKFKITGERFAESCNITEYLLVQNGNKDIIIRIAPRFILDGDGKYIVKVNTDSDGDIETYEGLDKALIKLSAVTPKRLDKLVGEFQEAARNIVNPPSAEA